MVPLFVNVGKEGDGKEGEHPCVEKRRVLRAEGVADEQQGCFDAVEVPEFHDGSFITFSYIEWIGQGE